MGTNSIPSATTGTIIPAKHHNSLKEALTTNLVPRNISGNPIANAGDLGSSSLPWLRMFFGLVSSGMSIEDAAGKMVLKINSSTKVTIGPNGIEAGSIAPNSITLSNLTARPVTTNGTDPGLNGISKSIESTTSVGNDNLVHELVNATLTTSGRPIFLFIESTNISDTASDSPIRITSSGTLQPFASFLWRRDSTNISTTKLEQIDEGGAFPVTQRFITNFLFLDTPSAGTYNYKFLVRTTVGNTVNTYNLRMVAYEI